VIALATLQSWVNWPLSPDEITIGPDRCPPLASGGFQAADAALRSEGWQALFLFVFVASVAAALLTVLVAYAATRRIGMPFVRRWWTFLGASVAAAVLAAVIMLVAIPVATAGCEGGEGLARVPGEWVALRTLVAAMHGLVFYVFLSWLLSTLLGRMLKQRRWYDNHRVPFPSLLPRRQG
jgi:hypothetical protein